MGALSIRGATALLALGLFNCILILTSRIKNEVFPASNRALPVVVGHDGSGVAAVTIKPEMSFGDSNSGMAAWVPRYCLSMWWG